MAGGLARPRRRSTQVACFIAGWLVLVAALMPPVHTLGEMLFSVHMVEHELLMTVAAPLLVLGRPLIAFLWALPQPARRDLGWLSRARPGAPYLALCYEGNCGLDAPRHCLVDLASARSVRGSSGERACSFAAAHFLPRCCAALLDLAAAASPRCRERWRCRDIAVCDHGAQRHSRSPADARLGGVVPAIWREIRRLGFDCPEDQQLAGLVMWVPGGLAFMGAALALAGVWLSESETRARRWETTLPKQRHS